MGDRCPCCGAPVRVEAWKKALSVLTPQQRRIAEIVASRPGIRMIEVADLVYADDPDGGPEWAEASLAVQTCRANARLAPFGFAIRAGRGCRNGYRVTKIGEGAA